MNFSKEEMVDMISILGECDRNSLLASRVYAERFPNARCFKKLLIRFIETGNITYKKHDKPKTATTEDNQLSVMLTVTEDPYKSQRDFSVNRYKSNFRPENLESE
ncbi:hypothetical protein HHI36_006683 [Cryptolaemus montrouzieri]|uniref:DUF4817 domain-containing protein n=1 Tax=Cryptolaemus montrouzieri TaxID=559131 RepID=A0ABD2NY74_9CUCU